MEASLAEEKMTNTENPFPGLRPFKANESDLFFGRESQVELVIEQLMHHKFIAIVGASGVGKSSFMSCGVLSELVLDIDEENKFEWEFLSMTPGRTPMKNLSASMVFNKEGAIKEESVEVLEEELIHSPESFKEIVNGGEGDVEKRYLLFIDQFEEIFRFSPDEEEETKSAKALIDVILSTLEDRDCPIYIVVAIRADFIGECARFPRLTKIINNSQYLIPQLTREEKKMAIVGPVKYREAYIEDDLVECVLDEMGERPDQLPIMQHALMRTWSQWSKFKPHSAPITMDDYRAIGGMKDALSEHAREAYIELSRADQALCKKIFKTLTEKGEEGRGVRRPTRLKDICDIVDADQSRIVNIINFFRSPSRSLLLPPATVELNDDSVIDISHESLMRNWVELSEWVDEEAESVKLYLRLAEAAMMHQEGKAGLWVPPDLLLAEDWQKKEKPTLGWGLMHNKAYESAMLFLEHSKGEYERNQILKEKVQKRRVVIFTRIAIVMFLLTLAAGWSWIAARESAQVAEKKKQEALVAQQEAVESAELAEESAKQAEKERINALISANIAKEQERVARAAKVEADSNATEAKRQEKLAVEKQKEAAQLRLLSIAKSMAIKSKEIDDESMDKKALVAKQAFNFYSAIDATEKVKKLEKDPDIYDGLYYALKAVGDENTFSLSEHEQNVRRILTLSDGITYTTGSDGNIIKWKNNAFDSYVRHNKKGTRINKSIALNSDNSLLACSGNFNFIEIYDVKTNLGLIETIPTAWTDTWHVAFTHDDKLVCIGSNNQLMSYDLDDKQFVPITNSEVKINAVSVHPKKNYLVAAFDNGELTRFDLDGGSSKVLHKGRAPIYSVTHSDNGRYMAFGDEKGKVFLVSPNNTLELPGHGARVNQLSFDHQNHFLATASFDKTVRIWNVQSHDDAPIILKDHKDWVWSVAFTQNDDFLWAGSRDYLIRTWPLDLDYMASTICPRIQRDKLNEEEWIHYAGEDFSKVVNSTCN